MSSLHRFIIPGTGALAACLLWAACLAGVASASVDYGSVSFVDQSHG